MVSEMDDYQYSKISDQNTIRLIFLQPSPDLEAEVRCSLIQASLEELEDDIIEHYIALSYVWGDPTLSCSALVDGRRVRITPSLDCALRHLREPNKILRLWADGICINQNDVEDRNQQVRLMGSVYTLAQHTIIFLGPSNSEADFVIQYIAAQRDSKSQTPSSDNSALSNDLEAALNTNILSHPWFTRVWVLQELVLSRDPWIQYGKARVRWDLFSRFALSGSAGALTDPGASSAAGMIQLRKVHRKDAASNTQTPNSSSNEALLNILLTRRGAGVSDPRDMVYGHLGLLDRPTVPPIEIDYGRSIAEVYEDIARHYIKRQSVRFLQYVEDIELHERRDGLPSWVPDWTVSSTTLPLDTSSLVNTKSRWHFPSANPHVLVVNMYDYGRIMYLLESPYSLKNSKAQFGDDGPRTSFPEYFEEQLAFGSIDRKGKFSKQPDQNVLKGSLPLIKPILSGRKPSTDNALKERITEFKLHHTPETIYDVFKATCAKFYDVIEQSGNDRLRDPGTWDTKSKLYQLRSYIADRFNISTHFIPSKHKNTLKKLTVYLFFMEDFYFTKRAVPQDWLIAILDSGGYMDVPRRVRVGDGVCGLFDSFIFFRPTPPTESEEMIHRLQFDHSLREFARPLTVPKDGSIPIQCGRYVGQDCFNGIKTRLNHARLRALTPIKDEKRMLLALH
ncbi:uncharacterized protein PAC_05504 [Phialocephala subalpina]|uniref:Heterokaryon incompatibility domain-containing protein n=1 Tax=Phialocephala subalpina TaxID=576137 RepID=A0A1L7WS63_9HELO|nr:uncharacterized protein PAC_05504 [Phialocephala subalpina]